MFLVKLGCKVLWKDNEINVNNNNNFSEVFIFIDGLYMERIVVKRGCLLSVNS